MVAHLPLRIVGVAVVLAIWSPWWLRAAEEGEAGKRGELDVVITTRLSTTKEHVAAYREAMQKSVQKAFGSLNPVIYGAEQKPVDGTARFRLVVDHRGLVTVGDAMIPVRHRNPGEPDRVSWQVQASQEGEIVFRFMEWDGAGYKRLGEWSIPASEGAAAGRIEVAREEVAAGRAIPREPPMPVDEARIKALEKLKPRDLGLALLDGFLRVELLRADAREDGDRVKGAAEVALTNLSPWPVTKAMVMVEWAVGPREALRIMFEQRFDKGLMTRQNAVFSGEGWTAQADPNYLRQGRVVSADFAPAPPRRVGVLEPAGKPR